MGDEANGTSNSDQPPMKRFRKDDNVDPTNPDPSIVVHVRNLSSKATEADLIEALTHFGSIAYATCMPNKRMALVEFEDISAAKNCVTYAQNNQIYVAGQPALFNYSTSKNIQRIGLECEVANCVVILTIFNSQYPITVDIIYQICKPHGEVRRIALLRRALLQALVEFESIEHARKAKHALNGADIYSGCCTVKIEFAKPDHVKITRNDQDQFDYTLNGHYDVQQQERPPMPNRQGLLGSVGNSGPINQQQNYSTGGYGTGNYGGAAGGGYGSDGGGGGGYGSGGGYGYGNDYNYPSYPPSRGSMGGGGASGQGQGGPMMGYGGGQGAAPPNDNSYGNSCVVMVYGIDQAKMNCDKLFNLLCVYGNVFRIKFMKSKPDTAMVQMGDPTQVQCAIDNLHNTILHGQKLALRVSKQPTLHDIRDPFDLPDGQPSFRDYTQSRNNRYLTPEAASRNRVVHPTNCLHWFNAPSTMTEEKMSELLAANGAPTAKRIIIFPVKSERSSSGIAEFESAEDAMEAIILNNHTAVDSPIGKIPYIVKLAFAWPRGEKERY